ncbi:HAMP domain-containing sensor histidine kinase [Actinomadura scrupuli]|uniref:HAMP domain-containing sensor histidine kinase n=1 Tax=Actinomadura scrupuli TaxID=559629 RepID=UPI003D95C318
MRLSPRSIRARDTLIATVVSAVLLTMLAVGVDVAVRRSIVNTIFNDSQRAATKVVAEIRKDALTDPVPAYNGIPLIQVFDMRKRLVHASAAGARVRPLSAYQPSLDEPVRNFAACDAGRCRLYTARRMLSAPVVIYAGVDEPWLLHGHHLEYLLGTAVLLLVLLAGLSTWYMVGRTLRPIEEVRAQLAEISGTDLSRRVSEPCGIGEIAELARTANQTIERLERSVERQRRFASDASHELRSPIAGLRTELESALMYPEDTDLVGTLSAALRDTDRLEAIITDLLLLARLGTGGPVVTEEIDLAEMVSAELEMRPSSAPIVTDLCPGVRVKGVRIQLVRVLDNLLDNAERHGDGSIDVAVAVHRDRAILMITDRGKGIAVPDRERAFERFTRLDSARARETGGTGLGLAIARDIAVAHGGTLLIEDSPQGARLVLRLPLAGRE